MGYIGIVTNAIVVVLGIGWCKHLLGRLPEDLADWRAPETDRANRLVIAGYWGSGVLAAWWVVSIIRSVLGG